MTVRLRSVNVLLPPWPKTPPSYGSLILREFRVDDVPLAMELGEDPYVPLIGSLPARPTPCQAREWVERQRRRYDEGVGFSFVVVERATDTAVGTIGLWLRELSYGRASVGYSVAPRHRGRGIAGEALGAVTAFAWTIPELHRIQAYIEPWNHASRRAAENAGYRREGLLRGHQRIGGTYRDMLLYATVRSR